MAPRTHLFDCTPEALAAIAEGRLRHDLRPVPAGGIDAGDAVRYRSADAEIRATVTYVTSAGNPCALSPDGLDPGHCIISLAPADGTIP